MKKVLSVIMITVLCLITAACGSTGTSADTSTGADVSADTSMAAEESTAPSAAESDEAQQTADDQRDLLAAFNTTAFPEKIGPFTAEDLDGNQITEEYFAGADVTIVHLWATYCDPCLKEMENLGKMAESLPDNAQVIGIAADVDASDASTVELAQQIMADNNIKFPSIIPGNSFSDLFASVVGVPTTFIVDPEGNVVAEPIVGSDVVGYKRMAREYLDSLEG